MNYAILKDFFESLTQDTRLEEFSTIYDVNVHFKDPFNDVKGINNVFNIFGHMFRNLNKPHFIIQEYIQNDQIVYVKWRFSFYFTSSDTQQSFEGVSRLVLGNDDRIIEHIDYWDAAEHMYEKITFVGSILRFVKNKIVNS